MARFIVGIAALALAAGCSDVGSDGGGWDTGSETFVLPDNGTGDVGPLDDPGGGDLPVVFSLCSSDDDCTETGAICSCTGDCVVPEQNACATDMNCQPGNWCNPCTKHCEPKVMLCEPCSPAVCDSTGVCTPLQGACDNSGACMAFATGDNFCTQSCVTDVGCPAGFACLEVGTSSLKQCVPKSGDCLFLGLCQSDAECPDGEICNDTLKICAQGCQDDESCPGAQVCVWARCVDPCTTADDCEPGEECTPEGHCKIPGSCESSAECEPEHYCNKETGMCTPGCLQDADCQDAGKECKALSCVEKGCEHNYQCAFEKECQKSDGQCIEMTRDHCAPCDASAEDQCGGDPNLCVTFQSEDEQTGQTIEHGDFCLLTCEEDPIDKCPAGYGCEHIEAPDAGIDGFYCVRMCYQDPYGGQPE